MAPAAAALGIDPVFSGQADRVSGGAHLDRSEQPDEIIGALPIIHVWKSALTATFSTAVPLS